MPSLTIGIPKILHPRIMRIVRIRAKLLELREAVFLRNPLWRIAICRDEDMGTGVRFVVKTVSSFNRIVAGNDYVFFLAEFADGIHDACGTLAAYLVVLGICTSYCEGGEGES